jgi:hypothetical protein
VTSVQTFILRQEQYLYQRSMQVFATNRYNEIKKCRVPASLGAELHNSEGLAVGKANFHLQEPQVWNLFRFDRHGCIYPFSPPSSPMPPTALCGIKKRRRLTEICLDDDRIANDL